MDTLDYFLSLDIKIFEIYGMSECTGPHTYNCQGHQKIGSIGRSLPGCHSKIATKADEGW